MPALHPKTDINRSSQLVEPGVRFGADYVRYYPNSGHSAVQSQVYLNKVARQLNERPRETLQFETPAERFNACVASIS
jgi:hypothetical protein